MEWMLMPLRKYAQFSGRSQRKEFWLWVLGVVIVTVILSILDTALGLGGHSTFGRSTTPYGASFGANASGGVLTTIFALAILIPNLAVSVRRLHDTDRSGWWVLLPIVPYILAVILMVSAFVSGSFGTMGIAWALMLLVFICAIVLLVFYCLPGTRGPNRFGPDPLGDLGNLSDTFA